MEGVKLTGLWKNESRDGKSYIAGNVSATARLLVLVNERKRADKEPDYIAYLVPVERRGGDANSSTSERSSAKGDGSEDLPF